MNLTQEINSALKEFSLGKKEIAYNKLKKIFKKNLDNDQLRFNIAVIEQSLNLNKEAKKNYFFLINKNQNQKAMINLYLLLIQEEKFAEALDIINKLILQNSNINIIKDKAFVLYKLKRHKESISICQKHLSVNKDIIFFNILGLNYFSGKEYEKSEKIFKEALVIEKDNPIILNSLGRMYHEKRDSENAETYLVKAYNINKNSYEILNNLAGFYREEGEYYKSIDLYLAALKIKPQNATVNNNLAKAYFDIDRMDLAKKYCFKALELNKKDSNIHKILSLIYLREQNYEEGWKYFDGRLNLSDFVEKNSSINNIRKKLLNNSKLNKKNKLLVLREQGVGDEILYGTMYGDLLNFCESVTIECDKRLKNIFCNSFPNYKDSFVEYGKISLDKSLLNDYDLALYAGSLGKFFRNKIEDFNNGSYLIAETNLLNKSRERFSLPKNKKNIGISWKSFKNRYSKEKSLTLESLNNIFKKDNYNIINLQYGDVINEIENYNNTFQKQIVTIDNLDLFNDFDNVACVLKNLDLFISVSNSTAHLAGSLGVKTLLIRPNNHAMFHYWNQPENKTPWYKSITLIDKNEIMGDENFIDKYLDI